MTNSLAFDTHKFVKDMTQADMPEKQAEVLAKHYANLLNDRLATKDDLKDLEQRLDARFEAIDARFEDLEQRIDAKIENSEQRLWIKMLVLQIASIATIITALQYLN